MGWLREKLQPLYERVVKASQPPAFLSAPSTFQRSQLNLCAFEASVFKRNLLGSVSPRARVLILGDTYGVDYFSLLAVGCRVFVLDVAPQEHIPDLILGDANQPLPFRDDIFDVAIAAEVLEHLVDDATCLRELRRVLRPEGKMIVTVLFHHDRLAVHVRIHSPDSIQRILEATGFSVVCLVERGGFINLERLPPYVWIKHGINALCFLATGRTWYRTWNHVLSVADWWIGTRARFAVRHTLYWGGYLLAVKGDRKDFSALNREMFRFSSSPVNSSR